MKLDFPKKQRSFQVMSYGGKRPGSGRKAKNPKTILSRIDKVTAATILAQIDENQVWLKHIKSADERISLDALKFLTSMRDGKPKQPLEHSGPGGGAVPIKLVVNFTQLQPNDRITG